MFQKELDVMDIIEPAIFVEYKCTISVLFQGTASWLMKVQLEHALRTTLNYTETNASLNLVKRFWDPAKALSFR